MTILKYGNAEKQVYLRRERKVSNKSSLKKLI